MWRVNVIILHVFLAHAYGHVNEQLVDTMLDRAFQDQWRSPFQDRSLDDIVLGKPAATLQRASLLPSLSGAIQNARAQHIPCAEDLGHEIAQNLGQEIAKRSDSPESVGFRFQKCGQRWVRDDKRGATVADVQQGNFPTKVGGHLSGGAYTLWPVVYLSLLDHGLQSVSGEEALKMVREEEAVLVDVRLEHWFQKETMEGAVSVPLFRKVAGDSMFDNVKRLVMGMMAMEARERNPDFAAMALERLPRNTPIIVACDRGGSLESTVKKEKSGGRVKEYADPDRAFGIESRALKAAYELYEAGFTKVFFLKGGINQWRHERLPMAPGVALTDVHEKILQPVH